MKKLAVRSHDSEAYLWNVHVSSRTNFHSLWKLVQRPDPSYILTQLYHVQDGKLYGWKPHQKGLRTHLYYPLRVRRYEQLLARSLQLAKEACDHDTSQSIMDPRIHQLIRNPFPFVVYWMDFISCREHPWLQNSPFLAFLTFPSQQLHESCTPIAIPTYEQWRKYKNVDSDSSTEYWNTIFDTQTKKYPWDQKLPKAVWRGGTTGEKWEYPNWQDLPRVQMVQLAKANPTLMDAGFTNLNNRNEQEQKEIETAGLLANRIEMKDYPKFKAILDIDGNSWSSRFADLLCTNSVVIKMEPRWVDYFYQELQPWVHYVPANLSNLVDIVTLVTTSEDPTMESKLKQIVQNANDWCRSKMTAMQLSIDMIWIFVYYVDLLQHEDMHSHKYTQWKRNHRKLLRDWVEIPYNTSDTDTS